MKKYSIGTDIGGSHISCALVDLEEGKPVNGTRFEREVDNKADVDTILSNWGIALKKSINAIKDGELAGIGFGMPGPFEYSTGVARFKDVAKYESLNGVDIASALRPILGLDENVPIRFMNDASAFAVGEAWIGSAKGKKRCVAITLGTGFGSAFVSNGVPVVEGESVPKMGCLWHLPFKGDIADESFSTRWFIKRYKEVCGKDAEGVKQVAQAAVYDDSASKIFEEYGRNMGEFLGPWLNKFEAEVLVIGGNVALSYGLFGPSFESALSKMGVIHTDIKLSVLQEDAAIIGSARMLDDTFSEAIEPIVALM